MEIKGKVALVTGASQGIGEAIAIELAKQGASVAINFISHEELAKKILEECNKHSQGNMIIKADITKDKDVKSMMSRIREKYNHLDILVNNAGIFDEHENSGNLESFEKIFSVNFLGPVRVTKYALDILKEGKIVNVTSIHGKPGHGSSATIAYASLKAALDHYTKNMAKELAPKILVNALAPGKTLTPMWGEMSEEEKKEIGAMQLINRFIRPEEVAEGVVFLIRNDAMCGAVVDLDGGMSLKTLN